MPAAEVAIDGDPLQIAAHLEPRRRPVLPPIDIVGAANNQREGKT